MSPFARKCPGAGNAYQTFIRTIFRTPPSARYCGRVLNRFGERVEAGQVAVSFRCASCGEMAAVVRALPAGTLADMGPPLGPLANATDGVIVDYFGGTAWYAADTVTFERISAILGGDAADPVSLLRLNRDLAPFYCPDCGANYCRADWRAVTDVNKGFRDRTVGACPAGHKRVIDDA
jgi:predicted RNA-binding Zn-ribbon protein involved in translation (DUF1610 family)